MNAQVIGDDAESFALTPPDPAVLAPLSQAWERGWG
jgi:hypothetical protein